MNMQKRFTDLCMRAGMTQGSTMLFNIILVGRYNSRGREYHNLSHIEHCLSEMDSTLPNLSKPDEAETALWFHDLVYTPGDEKNEKDSAETFNNLFGNLGVPETFRNRVSDLILFTKHDKIPVDDTDARYVMDIDLSSLGSPEPSFIEDENKIRREFSVRYSSEQFRQSRIEFAEKMLARPSIYLTDFFKAKYESQARQNFQNAIARLKSAK
jgi:predicted metal-dependent HD superfamily phosphohydrolase